MVESDTTTCSPSIEGLQAVVKQSSIRPSSSGILQSQKWLRKQWTRHLLRSHGWLRKTQRTNREFFHFSACRLEPFNCTLEDL